VQGDITHTLILAVTGLSHLQKPLKNMTIILWGH
jgi:hypothetical protein